MVVEAVDKVRLDVVVRLRSAVMPAKTSDHFIQNKHRPVPSADLFDAAVAATRDDLLIDVWPRFEVSAAGNGKGEVRRQL